MTCLHFSFYHWFYIAVIVVQLNILYITVYIVIRVFTHQDEGDPSVEDHEEVRLVSKTFLYLAIINQCNKS